MHMQITSKGQVTIPKVFRDKLGIEPLGSVEFYLDKGRLCLRAPRKKSRGEAAVNALTGKGDIPLTTEEIMRLTRHD